MAIDADEALIGHPAELEQRMGEAPDPRILARGFPPLGWRGLVLAAAQRFETIEPDVLFAMAETACGVAREPDVSRLSRVLTSRCRDAVLLTERYMNRVEARP